MYERFTDRARRVMFLANAEAQRLRDWYIGTEHILLELLQDRQGVAARVLDNLAVDPRKVAQAVESLVHKGDEQWESPRLPLTPQTKKVLEYAMEEARNLQHACVGTEHLLLGLLRENEGVGAQVLMNFGLRIERVRDEVTHVLGEMPEGDPKLDASETLPS